MTTCKMPFHLIRMAGERRLRWISDNRFGGCWIIGTLIRNGNRQLHLKIKQDDESCYRIGEPALGAIDNLKFVTTLDLNCPALWMQAKYIEIYSSRHPMVAFLYDHNEGTERHFLFRNDCSDIVGPISGATCADLIAAGGSDTRFVDTASAVLPSPSNEFKINVVNESIWFDFNSLQVANPTTIYLNNTYKNWTVANPSTSSGVYPPFICNGQTFSACAELLSVPTVTTYAVNITTCALGASSNYTMDIYFYM